MLLRDWLKEFDSLSHPIGNKPKPLVARSHTFPALCVGHIGIYHITEILRALSLVGNSVKGQENSTQYNALYNRLSWEFKLTSVGCKLF